MKNRIKIIIALILLALSSFGQAPNTTKKVHGTFINFVYMDERNKYMNPAGVDNTSPELWRLKVKELSEMGIKYVIIMYVANDDKSFYPSDFMPHAYQAGKESPVEAVMNAADENDMKVFMSTGWAHNQDDNPRLPEIRRSRLK